MELSFLGATGTVTGSKCERLSRGWAAVSERRIAMWGNMMGWGGYGGGWEFFGVVHMLLWWVLLILGIVVLARWLFGGRFGGHRGSSEDRALAILRERYARGEIDKDEFEKRKRDLAG